MDLLAVENELLEDGVKYTGSVYVKNGKKIPHGYGRKNFPDYYYESRFIDGIANGPTYINHNHYMIACQSQNNRGNGWGMMIIGGVLTFGVYRNSELAVDLTNFVSWYFDKILKQNYQNSMFYSYPKAGEIFIGIPGKKYDEFTSSFMGFHFMDDGSLYVGTTSDLNKNGILLKFNNNGIIEIGEWESGKIKAHLSISEVLDKYWGVDIKDDIFGSLSPMRKKYNNVLINCNINYFNS